MNNVCLHLQERNDQQRTKAKQDVEELLGKGEKKKKKKTSNLSDLSAPTKSLPLGPLGLVSLERKPLPGIQIMGNQSKLSKSWDGAPFAVEDHKEIEREKEAEKETVMVTSEILLTVIIILTVTDMIITIITATITIVILTIITITMTSLTMILITIITTISTIMIMTEIEITMLLELEKVILDSREGSRVHRTIEEVKKKNGMKTEMVEMKIKIFGDEKCMRI